MPTFLVREGKSDRKLLPRSDRFHLAEERVGGSIGIFWLAGQAWHTGNARDLGLGKKCGDETEYERAHGHSLFE